MEDSEILDLYFSRSEQALSETAEKYGGYLEELAFRILKNRQDAEESVNDAYLDAWNAIPPQRPARFRGFLGKLTRARAIDRWRRQSAQKRGGETITLCLHELAGCIPGEGDPAAALGMKELERLLDQFLRTLPETSRRLFILRYWHMYSIAELCGQFGFTPSRTKSILFRTRKKLLAYLTERGAL